MEKLLDYIKEHKGFVASIGIVVVLITALCLVLFVDFSGPASNEPTIIESNLEILNEYDKVTDEHDLKVQDGLVSCIESGVSGVYEIEGRNFVVLTTGGPSQSDIEYNIETSMDGSSVVYYKLSDNVDSETSIRYKVIEVNSPDIRVEKQKPVNNDLNGFLPILVFEYGTDKKVYDIPNNQILDISIRAVPGIYMASFKDNQVDDFTDLNVVTIENCEIIDKVVQARRLYNIKLPTNDIIQVYLDKLNLESGEIVTLDISYDSVLGGFSANVIGGNNK